MSETMPQPQEAPGAPGGPDGPQTQTAVLERTEAVPEVAEPGDHERFAHYVRKEKIVESAVTGEPVTALCGKVWIPGRNPDRFPGVPHLQGDLPGPARPAGRRRRQVLTRRAVHCLWVRRPSVSACDVSWTRTSPAPSSARST